MPKIRLKPENRGTENKGFMVADLFCNWPKYSETDTIALRAKTKAKARLKCRAFCCVSIPSVFDCDLPRTPVKGNAPILQNISAYQDGIVSLFHEVGRDNSHEVERLQLGTRKADGSSMLPAEHYTTQSRYLAAFTRG